MKDTISTIEIGRFLSLDTGIISIKKSSDSRFCISSDSNFFEDMDGNPQTEDIWLTSNEANILLSLLNKALAD